MEKDKLWLAAGVTAAAFASAFVFWGPTDMTTRPKRAQIAGLHNFGQTCFLNTLLQSLASCTHFLTWLRHYEESSKKRKSIIASILNTLDVVNGRHPTIKDDPYAPNELINALSQHGWIIPNEEQDVHELFHVLLASLEDEAAFPQPIGCLSDALVKPNKNLRISGGCIGDQISYETSQQHGNMEKLGTDIFQQHITSPCLESNFYIEDTSLKQFSKTTATPHTLDSFNRSPGVISVRSSTFTIQVAHPFQGAMGMQIVCNTCGHKSVVRYDKFDSVTLNLPPNKTDGLNIEYLLNEYIAPEILTDVKCESCFDTSTHTQTTTFAKLPHCLCLHIARTVWLPTGEICKRQDYVYFPESLSMSPYCFVQPHLNGCASTSWGPVISQFSISSSSSIMFPHSQYRLLAVIVHSGDANSGHFVTYRRGIQQNSKRWFYTSDAAVYEVSIEDVLCMPAYMIFYERETDKQLVFDKESESSC